jgi:hypothetical protein
MISDVAEDKNTPKMKTPPAIPVSPRCTYEHSYSLLTIRVAIFLMVQEAKNGNSIPN